MVESYYKLKYFKYKRKYLLLHGGTTIKSDDLKNPLEPNNLIHLFSLKDKETITKWNDMIYKSESIHGKKTKEELEDTISNDEYKKMYPVLGMYVPIKKIVIKKGFKTTFPTYDIEALYFNKSPNLDKYVLHHIGGPEMNLKIEDQNIIIDKISTHNGHFSSGFFLSAIMVLYLFLDKEVTLDTQVKLKDSSKPRSIGFGFQYTNKPWYMNCVDDYCDTTVKKFLTSLVKPLLQIERSANIKEAKSLYNNNEYIQKYVDGKLLVHDRELLDQIDLNCRLIFLWYVFLGLNVGSDDIDQYDFDTVLDSPTNDSLHNNKIYNFDDPRFEGFVVPASRYSTIDTGDLFLPKQSIKEFTVENNKYKVETVNTLDNVLINFNNETLNLRNVKFILEVSQLTDSKYKNLISKYNQDERLSLYHSTENPIKVQIGINKLHSALKKNIIDNRLLPK